MDQELLKIRVQGCIVGVSVLLLAGKFTAFFITNSVGILTDALESIINVAAGFIGLYSVRLSARPKDRTHPFGHGKIESISASAEGLLILFAGGIIIYEGIVRLFQPAAVERLDAGIWVVAAAGLVNYVMGWVSVRIGKRYRSIALEAGGRHLQSDTYSTVGLVLGLVFMQLTGFYWIDGLLGLVFGSVILIAGIRILRRTTADLMDKTDERVLAQMAEVIACRRREEWIDVHNMKTIRYGSSLYVDCDLTLPWYYTVERGHAACEALKELIADAFSGRVLISIHSDPCNPDYCPSCRIASCVYRQAPFSRPFGFTPLELAQNDEERKENNKT